MQKTRCACIFLLILLLFVMFPGCSSGRWGGGTTVITGRATGRIYVANSLDDSVEVIDARNNTRISGSPFDTGGEFPAGMALDTSRHRLYVANYTGRSISVFNTQDMSQAAGSPFPVEQGPYGLALDESLGRLYAVSPDSSALYVFDALTMTPIPGSPFAVGETPYTVITVPSRGQVVVAGSAGGSLTIFDSLTMAQVPGSPLATTPRPFGLAYDQDRNVLFVTGLDVRLYDFDSLEQLNGSPLYTGGGVNKGIAVNPGTRRAWVGVSDKGQVSLFDTGEMKEVAGSPFAFPGSPEDLAINLDEELIYAADSSGNQVRIYSTGMIEAQDSPLSTGSGPRKILLDPGYGN